MAGIPRSERPGLIPDRSVSEPILTRRIGSQVRIRSRKCAAADIGRLILPIDAGSSVAGATFALKRSISVVQNKARSLGNLFQSSFHVDEFPQSSDK